MSDFTISVPTNYRFIAPQSTSNSELPVPKITKIPSLDALNAVPAQLSSNIYAVKDGLVEGDWKNFLMRCFVPSYASEQDASVTRFFISFFKEIFKEDPSNVDKQRLKSMLSFSEQHIARGKGWFSNSATPANARLEHYLLAARNRFNLFDAEHDMAALTEKCRLDNKSLLSRWNKLGFAQEAFWDCPDLVDFVFKAHLHRHIAHPYYRHTISMLPYLKLQNEQISVVREPHLLVDGRQTPWSTIREKMKLDKSDRIYSIEGDQKKYWMYLDQGLTQWDKYNVERPRRLMKLDTPPLRSRVEVITTHAHKEDWHLGDRLLKGTRHSFFRFIPSIGFSQRHPEAGLVDGEVYSLGWGARWADFSLLGPLSTMKGRWFCPDNFEFLKEDLCITPIETSDEQILALLDVVKRRSREDLPFHVVTANCCGATGDVLNEAGILSLCTKDHMAHMWYKFLLPKYIRTHLNNVAHFFRNFTPDFVAKVLESTGAFLYSVVFAPIFSLLGAWRTNITYEDEGRGTPDQIRAGANNRVKALFSNVFDMFNPNKMKFDLTKTVYKWQKMQPGTRREIRD